MCGIVAIIKKRGQIDQKELLKISDMLKHRGPDDEGIFISNDMKIGLAHKRLAIIDLTPTGHQPMISSNERFVLIFNGEIYNYLELSKQLKNKRLKGTSDSEVLLEFFSENGVKIFNQLNGMWAIIIYDLLENKVVISRDRYGIKPLYLFESNNSFVISSEIKPILKFSEYSKDLNDYGIVTFLVNGVVDGIEESTFKNIRRFPPGTYGIIDLNDTAPSLKIKRFYRIGEQRYEIPSDYRDVILYFRELFVDSVKLRLRSDVELGVSLSGGLDSSSIFAVASILTSKPIYAFSSVYQEKTFDESRFSRLMIERFNGIGYEITPTPENFERKYRRILFYLEEPNKSMGVYSQWHVIELASKYVKVLLDGQGGDELLAGYFPYFVPYLADLIMHTPEKAISELMKIKHITGIPPYKILGNFAKALLRFGPVSESLFNPEFEELASSVPFYFNVPKEMVGYLNRRLYNDFTYLMLPNFLRYEDRISMAFSMESRLPFLDFRLVDFVFSLPFHFKIRHGWTKWLLRIAMNTLLPEDIRWRSDKKGFPTPFRFWLVRKDFLNLLENPKFALRYLTKTGINKIRRCALEGKRECVELAWRIINMELWHEIFFGNSETL